MDDFALALAHYALLFPDVGSLGSGAATWRTEYDRLVDAGLSATLVTSTGDGAGTQVSGSRNFDQKILLAALHLRRATLDEAYEPFVVPALDARPRRELGIAVRLGF